MLRIFDVQSPHDFTACGGFALVLNIWLCQNSVQHMNVSSCSFAVNMNRSVYMNKYFPLYTLHRSRR